MRTPIRFALMGCLGFVTTQAAAQEPRTTWTFSGSAQESNEFSREFNGQPQEDLILDNANVGLQLSTRTQRSQVGLFGRVGANVYREGPPQADRLNYGGGLSWSYAPSERLSSSVSASVSRDFQAGTLSDLGVLATNINSTAATGSWGLEYRTSPRTTVSTSLSYSYAQFQTPDAVRGSQLVLNTSPFEDVFPSRTGAPVDPSLTAPDAEDAVLRILATEGLSSGETTSHWGTATFGLARQLTQYTSLGFDLAGGYRRIDARLRALQEGAEAAGRFWVERAIGSSTGLLSSYELRRSLAIDPAATIQMLMGGFAYAPSGRSLNVSVQGGASYYQAEGSPSLLTPSVNTSLTASLTRTTRFGASYRRQFQQSLGFGQTLLIDFVNLTLSQDFGSRVTLTAVGGASLGQDPLVEASKFDAYRAGGTLTVRIVEPLSAGTSFYALETQQRLEGIDADSTRNLWTLFVNFAKSWN